MAKLDKEKLRVRLTTYQDIPDMVRLSQKVYPDNPAKPEELEALGPTTGDPASPVTTPPATATADSPPRR